MQSLTQDHTLWDTSLDVHLEWLWLEVIDAPTEYIICNALSIDNVLWTHGCALGILPSQCIILQQGWVGKLPSCHVILNHVIFSLEGHGGDVFRMSWITHRTYSW